MALVSEKPVAQWRSSQRKPWSRPPPTLVVHPRLWFPVFLFQAAFVAPTSWKLSAEVQGRPVYRGHQRNAKRIFCAPWEIVSDALQLEGPGSRVQHTFFGQQRSSKCVRLNQTWSAFLPNAAKTVSNTIPHSGPLSRHTRLFFLTLLQVIFTSKGSKPTEFDRITYEIGCVQSSEWCTKPSTATSLLRSRPCECLKRPAVFNLSASICTRSFRLGINDRQSRGPCGAARRSRSTAKPNITGTEERVSNVTFCGTH